MKNELNKTLNIKHTKLKYKVLCGLSVAISKLSPEAWGNKPHTEKERSHFQA